MEQKILLSLFLLLACLQGCASHEPPPANPDLGLQGVRDELSQVDARISDTQAALADLTSDPSVDLKPKFDRFETAFNQTVDQAKQLKARADYMRSSGRKIMARWADESMVGSSEQLEEHRRKFAGKYDALNERFADTREALEPYMQDLYDTIGFVKTDLNETRVMDIRDMAAQSAEDARVVQDRIGKVIEQLDELRALQPVISK